MKRAKPMSAGMKIFVVDDEIVISSTLAAILCKSGFDATAFSNPMEALWAVEASQPQLVITDVSMPEMNGIELGIRIRAKLPNCKVLLFSGQAATTELLADAKMRGHKFDCLAKPMHPRDLLIAINSMAV
jgi:DNA-binding NtrC family response regulator